MQRDAKPLRLSKPSSPGARHIPGTHHSMSRPDLKAWEESTGVLTSHLADL